MKALKPSFSKHKKRYGRNVLPAPLILFKTYKSIHIEKIIKKRRKHNGLHLSLHRNRRGKTTNALGLALRSIGHKHRVIIIQFLKWWKNTGEFKIKKMLAPYYEIYQFGRKGWIGLSNLGDEDKKLAQKALEFAEKIVEEKKPSLLVLDEINLALHCKLLDVRRVLEFLDEIPKETDVILTGRFAPKELLDRADFVNEVKDIKYPKETVTTKGIQY